MTSEEAIRELKIFSGTTKTRLSANFWKALEMAIKALSEEPCEDAVSRANLLKTFEDRFIELQKAHRADTQSGVNWCINTLKDMPSVTPIPEPYKAESEE